MLCVTVRCQTSTDRHDLLGIFLQLCVCVHAHVCFCVRVCLNPCGRKSAGNGGTSTAVFTFTFQQEYLLGSKQIDSMCTEERFHVASKRHHGM